MGCLKTKYKDKMVDVDGNRSVHPSKKHYRPHHYALNREMERFDNDVVWCYGEELSIETGINKQLHRATDTHNSNYRKDGN